MKKSTICLMIIILFMGLCGCGKEKAGTETGSDASDNEFYALTLLDDVSSYIVEALSVPHENMENGIMHETVHRNKLYYLSNDGDRFLLCQLDLDNPSELKISPLDIPPDTWVETMAISGDGSINIVTQYLEDPEEAGTIDKLWYQLDGDGVTLRKTSIIEALSGFDILWAYKMLVDDAGNAYITSARELCVLDPAGKLLFQTRVNGGFIWHLEKGIDGQVYVQYVQGSQQKLTRIDFEAQSPDADYDYSIISGEVGISCFSPPTEELFFFTSHKGAYAYHFSNGKTSEFFSWPSLNLKPLDIIEDKVFLLSGGRVLFCEKEVFTSLEGNPTKLSIIRPMTASELAKAEEKSITSLTLGTVGPQMSSGIRQSVFDFNRANPDSRIEIVEYGTDDPEAGLMRLNADIINGNCPDILLLPARMSLELYARKGALKDLHNYINADASFDWADYQENIIRAYESEGKLFGFPLNFWVKALTVRAGDIDGRNEWMLDEFIDFAGSFGDTAKIFREPTKTAVLKLCLTANGENIVDWNSQDNAGNDVGFDRNLFIKMLEFAGRFENEYPNGQFLDERARNGDLKILDDGYVGATMVQYYEFIFGGPISYVGYPSEQGSGLLVTSDAVVAISAKCEEDGIAWAFISSLLSEKAQSNIGPGGTAIRKSVVQELFKKLKEYEGEDRFMATAEISETFVISTMTDDEIEMYLDLISRANKIQSWDNQIENIIMEEAGAYFSGSKTLEQVADVVENRIGIYVKEMK